MDYEIIATLGPSSSQPLIWKAMLTAGASAFRLNTSHLSLTQLNEWLEKLDIFFTGEKLRPPVVLDLQGSKWRLGHLPAGELLDGQQVELVLAPSAEQPGILPVPHADFFRAAPFSNGEIVLNDAKVRLKLDATRSESASARVIQGGPISANKGITFSSSAYRTETLSEKDRAIIESTRGFTAVRFAISYVKDAAEMAHYRALVNEKAGSAYLIAKLERGPAVEECAQIAQSADELWLCRGDLGAELGLKGMAEAAYRFGKQVRSIAVPSIMAGQVLEHMTAQPNPTRSEVCYLHDTLEKGYRGFVLSDEAAVGRYPVESCQAAALFR